MRADRGPTPGVLALAALLVGVAGRLVPTAVRADWEREWNAELWCLYRSLEQQRRLTARDRAAFLLRSAGSVVDAFQLRLGDAPSVRESFSAVVTRWGQHGLPVTTALLVLSLGIAADALLIAFGWITVGDPRSMWSSLSGELRLLVLAVAGACGVSLIVASAAAAAQLLGSADPPPDGSNGASVVELVLVAGITGWLGRRFAAFGVGTALHPRSAEWLASIDLDAAVTGSWVVSWALGLVALAVLRARRRRRPARLPG